MNILFIASIKGGRAQQPFLEIIAHELTSYGRLHSSASDPTLSHYGETELRDSDILKRELEALAGADAVIAEVTTPSLGVGYLIARAAEQRKKVIALYYGEDTLKLSSVIKGDERVSVHTYKAEEDIKEILKTTLAAQK